MKYKEIFDVIVTVEPDEIQELPGWFVNEPKTEYAIPLHHESRYQGREMYFECSDQYIDADCYKEHKKEYEKMGCMNHHEVNNLYTSENHTRAIDFYMERWWYVVVRVDVLLNGINIWTGYTSGIENSDEEGVEYGVDWLLCDFDDELKTIAEKLEPLQKFKQSKVHQGVSK